AVTAISNSYQDIYREEESRLSHSRTGALSERQRVAKDRLDALLETMDRQTREYGPEELLAGQVREAQRLTSMLHDEMIARADASADASADTADPFASAAVSATRPVR